MEEVISSFPQEFCKEFLKEKMQDIDIKPLIDGAKVTVNNIVNSIPKDQDGNYFKKQFFLGNYYVSIRLHSKK